MKHTQGSFVVAGLVGLAASVASAAPITFIHDGSGSGTLDGDAFSAVFTITATGDTSNRNNLGGFGWDIAHTTATINIDGVGVFDFVSPTRTFINNDAWIVGFSRTGNSGADLFNGPQDAALAAWDMTASIGPISGEGELLQWGNLFDDVMTTGGLLRFDDFFTDARFTAIVVPAPATLLALGGLLATRRRR